MDFEHLISVLFTKLPCSSNYLYPGINFWCLIKSSEPFCIKWLSRCPSADYNWKLIWIFERMSLFTISTILKALNRVMGVDIILLVRCCLNLEFFCTINGFNGTIRNEFSHKLAQRAFLTSQMQSIFYFPSPQHSLVSQWLLLPFYFVAKNSCVAILLLLCNMYTNKALMLGAKLDLEKGLHLFLTVVSPAKVLKRNNPREHNLCIAQIWYYTVTVFKTATFLERTIKLLSS